MNKLLIVAATSFEIEPLKQVLKPRMETTLPFLTGYKSGNWEVDLAITGVGMSNTAFFLGQLAGKTYTQVINAGVCGSFRDDIKVGEVIFVEQDCYSEMGAQNDESFLPLSEIGLGNENVIKQFPILNQKTKNLRRCKGVTVNKVHGNENSIKKLVSRLNPDVESMEGAAFLEACNYYKWPCAQIRAVSNKVEKRNKANWEMALAIKNLNDFLIDYIKEL